MSGCRLQLFNPARVYDLFGEMLSALNIFSLFLCLFLYFKGKWAPSSSDSGTTGSLIYDFFWGERLCSASGWVPAPVAIWLNAHNALTGLCCLISSSCMYRA